MAVKILTNGEQVIEISRVLNCIEGGVDMDKVSLHTRDANGCALATSQQNGAE